MHRQANQNLLGWVRQHFGIEDDEELEALLADPDAMLALLDMTRATGEDTPPSAPRIATAERIARILPPVSVHTGKANAA